MKVNWLKVCAIGLKVLLAVGTGFAVYAGVNHVVNNTETTASNNDGGFKEPTISSTVTTKESSNKVNVVGGLRATQNSLERIMSVVGSLATAAESISMIFSNTTPVNYRYGNNQAWFSGSGNYWQSSPQGGNFYGNRQINPFIQEVGRPYSN